MSTDVGDAYDTIVELYASINLDSLTHDTNARAWLASFARLASPDGGVVADLGCGPGHVVHHLSGLGVSTVGYDISPGQVARARQTFPAAVFHVGDLAALEVGDGALGGIVSRYSIIHLPPARLGEVFEEWMRVLEPGAPVLLSFFGSLTADSHGTPFDHKVTTAYELFPATVAQQLRHAGFDDIDVGVMPPLPGGGRPFVQATILGRKPAV